MITAAPTRGEPKRLVVDALHEFPRSLERELPLAPGRDCESTELLINA